MKNSLLLFGTLSWMLIATPTLITHAEMSASSSQIISQGTTTKITLDANQKIKAKKIRDNTLKQIVEVLNKDQKTQFINAVKKGGKPGQVLKTMKLEKTQQAKISKIVSAANKELESVLRKDQLEQLRKNRSQPDTI